MKEIYQSVALGIAAVFEMRDLIADERNEEKKETLIQIRYAYYYLIDGMNKQFGVTRRDVAIALCELGYEYETAVHVLDYYESWACHVVKKNCTKGDENL